MPVKSPYPSLQLPSTDVLSYVFGAGTPSDTPIWIDATDTSKFLSARTLLQWAKRLTIGLDRLGVQRGEVVLIYTPNHIFVPVAYLGVVGAGRVFSGANPAYGVEGRSSSFPNYLFTGITVLTKVEKNWRTRFEPYQLELFWCTQP